MQVSLGEEVEIDERIDTFYKAIVLVADTLGVSERVAANIVSGLGGWVMVSGAWRVINEAYVMVNGGWRQIMSGSIKDTSWRPMSI